MDSTSPNNKIPQEDLDDLSDTSNVCLANLVKFLTEFGQPDLSVITVLESENISQRTILHD